jgi:RNA-directed DNA polymerase
VLANLAFEATDGALVRLASERGWTFTRYADDLTFSGRGSPPPDLVVLVAALLREKGWNVAEGKTRTMHRPQQLEVLGLTVATAKPRLPKYQRNRTRAMRHMLQARRVRKKDIARIRGHVAYADGVDRWTPA